MRRLAAERETLARFLEHAPVPISIFQGQELVFTLANAAYRQMIGRSDLVGKPLLEVRPELRGQSVEALLRQVMTSGERHTGREVPVLLSRAGVPEDRYFNISYEPMRSDGLTIDAVMSTTVEVTREVQVRRALEFERRRWEQTAEQIPSGLVIADAASGKTVFANRRAQDLWGAAIKEAPHESQRWLAYDEEGNAVPADQFPIPRALRGETVTDCRMRFEVPGRVSAITRSNTAPIRDADGKVVAAVSVFDDVTAATAREQQRIELLASLQAEGEFRQRVLAIVGHDLRNPLGAILFGADLLLRAEELPERLSRTARRIRDSGERMRRMIAALLDYAATRQSGTLPIEPARIELRRLLRDAADELHLSGRQTTQITVEEGDDLWGDWDPDRLSELFGNLIGNAVQHGDRGAGVRISVRVEPEGGVAVEVRNQGQPIPPEALPTIFEAFRRASVEGGREGSLGLGLYIARQIAVAHGGSVEVTSSAAEGTCFTVRLRLAR